MIEAFIAKARELYGEGFIPLHRPVFEGNEKRYLCEFIDSNFVSSVGQRVVDFEMSISEFTGSKYAVAVASGTAGLQVALRVAGVSVGDEVLTQDLTFVATANAICHLGAAPVFLDVDIDSMGLSPSALLKFLEEHAAIESGQAYNKTTGARISACVPMHTFGNPGRIVEVIKICSEWGIPVIEDAAESLGSYIGDTHTGNFGCLGVFSFNGNKVITTGGGGVIVTNDESLAASARHLTTTAKVAHPYEFSHDEIAYNFRMPNLNAALGCAQMERLEEQLAIKQKVAEIWYEFFQVQGIEFMRPIPGCTTNNWLNAIRLNDRNERDIFIQATNEAGVMTRPVWQLMSSLPMLARFHCEPNPNAQALASTIVNISSSVPDGWLKHVESNI